MDNAKPEFSEYNPFVEQMQEMSAAFNARKVTKNDIRARQRFYGLSFHATLPPVRDSERVMQNGRSVKFLPSPALDVF